MKTLILLSHPYLAVSHAHTLMVDQVKEVPDVVIHHLEGLYPDGVIDVESEQAACEKAAVLVMQFPLWWHSSPPMLKHWQDEVLAAGWAYGPDGHKLAGKTLQLVVTAGDAATYLPDNDARFATQVLLRPFEATAHLCGMRFAEPLVLEGIAHPHGIAENAEEEGRIIEFAARFQVLLEGFGSTA
ncbi:NAD(P)H-dependent oxidoreductase [Andreprevotia chitinilytica]|uniref:NAD(P)H-dependent oxidoreductase n=1 Tax=Andreprevotia chitinilytica TaxID=396808 RepID=UPI00054EF1A0|nr:NAD(P)H-dependent oxidoreductase [Andreprevotia chitinilytica]